MLLIVGAVALRVTLSQWALPTYQRQQTNQALQAASLAQLAQATRIRPRDARPCYFLGRRWQALGNDTAAAAAFAEAARRDPDDAGSWLAWADEAAQQDSGRLERQIMRAFLHKHPDNADAHLALGRSEQQAGGDAPAVREAQTVLALAPQDARAWRLIAHAARHQNQMASAERALRCAIAADGREPDDYLSLGDLLSHQSRPADARTIYRAGAQKLPQDGLLQLFWGQAQLDAARTPKEIAAARDTLRRSTHLRPDLALAFVLIGASYIREGRWAEARPPLLQAEALPPGVVAVSLQQTYLLALADTRLGDTAEAARARNRHAVLEAYTRRKDRLIDQIRRQPSTMHLRLHLARLCAAFGEDKDAISVYRRLLEYAPGATAARQEMASLSLQMQASGPIPDHTPDSARSTPLLLRDSDWLLSGKQWEAAETAYARLVLRDKFCAPAYQGMGRAALGRGQADAAYRFLRHAVRLDARLAPAQKALAGLYQAQNLSNAARRRYEAALKSAPGDAEAWHSLGRVCGASDTYAAEGRQALRQAVALAPENSVYQRDLADALAEGSDVAGAEAAYRRAVARAPNDPDALARLGGFLVSEQSQSWAEAQSLLRRALARDPANDYAWYQEGCLALARKDARQAEVDLRRAAALAPDVADIWYALARAEQGLGNRAQARWAQGCSTRLHQQFLARVTLAEQAGLAPTNAGLRLRLARAYRDNGEYAEALTQYQSCVRLAPADPRPLQEGNALTARLIAAGRMPSLALYQTMKADAEKDAP